MTLLPIVTDEAMMAILQAQRLGRTASLTSDPQYASFLHLAVVDQVLQADFNRDDRMRPRVLEQVVTSHVLKAVNSILIKHGHPQLQDDPFIHDLISILSNFIGRTPKILVGLLWVYIHYCRYELECDRQQYCKFASIDIRTLQRYQSLAMTHVAQAIQRSEAELHRYRQKVRLYNRCQVSPEEVLSQSQIELVHQLKILCQRPLGESAHIVVYGPSHGELVVAVSQFTYAFIDDGLCEYADWVHSPVDIVLPDAAFAEGASTDERSDIHASRDRDSGLLLVIENADDWFGTTSTQSIELFLHQYRFSKLVFICNSAPLGFGLHPIAVRHSTESEYRLAQRRIAAFRSVPYASYADVIQSIVYPQTYHHTDLPILFDQCGMDEKLCLLIVAIVPDGFAVDDRMVRLLSSLGARSKLASLARLVYHNLLYSCRHDNGTMHYGMLEHVRQVIFTFLALPDNAFRLLLDDILGKLEALESLEHLVLAEYLILNPAIDLRENSKSQLIDGALRAGIGQRHWIQWFVILHNQHHLSPYRQWAYAICCLGLGYIERGRTVLSRLILTLGRLGAFHIQENVINILNRVNGTGDAPRQFEDGELSVKVLSRFSEYLWGNSITLEVSDPKTVVHVYGNTAAMYATLGDIDYARSVFREISEVLENLACFDSLLVAEHNLADIHGKDSS